MSCSTTFSAAASSFSWSPAALQPAGLAGAASRSGAGRKIDCGWYDSSFDLARGLEIVEQDDDALYQLWALARH